MAPSRCRTSDLSEATEPAAGNLRDELERRADRLTTPCGDGRMVWHRWGHGPAIVLLHGGYGSWTHWVRNIEQLSRSHSVLAADLPGLGDSDLPPEPADGQSLARIVAEGIRELVPGAARYDLVGFSFGGVLSGPIAVLEGRRVRSLTLVGSGGLGSLRRPIELRSWRQLSDPTARDAVHRENLAALMIADPAKIDDLAVLLQAENASRGRLKSRPISRTAFLADALPGVRAPVGAIFGERDATAWPHLDERIERLRRLRPELTVKVIPWAGHWVQYEAADAFNEALLDMLGSRVRSA